MAGSSPSFPLTPPDENSCRIPARTPGILGYLDQADPDFTTFLGNTQGPLGYNDHADPGLPSYDPSGTSALARTDAGTPLAVGSDNKVNVTPKQAAKQAKNKKALALANVKAFLDTIAEAEGGDYDLKFGGVKGKKNDKWRITDYSTHPGAGSDGKTTAAGRYQINKGTWKESGVAAMGLTDFSADTQDLIAVEILRAAHALDAVIDGDIPKALGVASYRWAALPQGPGQGGRYPGQPYMEYDTFISRHTANGGTVAKAK